VTNEQDDFEERYAKFVKPLEQEHWGEFVAVDKDGSLIISETLLGAITTARQEIGRGLFIYRVGDVAVGMVR
jgi:hypothetical protein